MKKSTKGFYTVEAALILPLMIIAVLSLGSFIKIESLWENCIWISVEEASHEAAEAYKGINVLSVTGKTERRTAEENPAIDSIDIRDIYLNTDNVVSYRVEAQKMLEFPVIMGKDCELDFRLRYRGFSGKRHRSTGLGAHGLQTASGKNAVWIFPQAGQKYHKRSCTYVRASVYPVILTNGVKSQHTACDLCDSGNIKEGSTVFCFRGEDTAYHRGSCRTIKRRYISVDKSEAVKRGYGPCSKCGGI